MNTTFLLAAAILFPPVPGVQAEGRVTVKQVKIGLINVRRADVDYVLRTDGSLRATGTAVITGDVTAKIVYLIGDTATGLYVAKLDALGGRIEMTGRLVDILKQLLPE